MLNDKLTFTISIQERGFNGKSSLKFLIYVIWQQAFHKIKILLRKMFEKNIAIPQMKHSFLNAGSATLHATKST